MTSNRCPSNEKRFFRSFLEHFSFDRMDQVLKTIYSCSNFIFVNYFFRNKTYAVNTFHFSVPT